MILHRRKGGDRHEGAVRRRWRRRDFQRPSLGHVLGRGGATR